MNSLRMFFFCVHNPSKDFEAQGSGFGFPNENKIEMQLALKENPCHRKQISYNLIEMDCKKCFLNSLDKTQSTLMNCDLLREIQIGHDTCVLASFSQQLTMGFSIGG